MKEVPLIKKSKEKPHSKRKKKVLTVHEFENEGKESNIIFALVTYAVDKPTEKRNFQWK